MDQLGDMMREQASSCMFLLLVNLISTEKMKSAVRPVSYTHLDVYKRQVEIMGQFENIIRIPLLIREVLLCIHKLTEDRLEGRQV